MPAKIDQVLAESQGVIGQAQNDLEPVHCEELISRSDCGLQKTCVDGWQLAVVRTLLVLLCPLSKLEQSTGRAPEATLLGSTVIFHHMRLLCPMLLYKSMIIYTVNRDRAPEAVAVYRWLLQCPHPGSLSPGLVASIMLCLLWLPLILLAIVCHLHLNLQGSLAESSFETLRCWSDVLTKHATIGPRSVRHSALSSRSIVCSTWCA